MPKFVKTRPKLPKQMLSKLPYPLRWISQRHQCPWASTKPDIDGFLVAGASLKPEFADIANCQGSENSLKPVNIGINGFGRI